MGTLGVRCPTAVELRVRDSGEPKLFVEPAVEEALSARIGVCDVQPLRRGRDRECFNFVTLLGALIPAVRQLAPKEKKRTPVRGGGVFRAQNRGERQELICDPSGVLRPVRELLAARVDPLQRLVGHDLLGRGRR